MKKYKVVYLETMQYSYGKYNVDKQFYLWKSVEKHILGLSVEQRKNTTVFVNKNGKWVKIGFKLVVKIAK